VNRKIHLAIHFDDWVKDIKDPKSQHRSGSRRSWPPARSGWDGWPRNGRQPLTNFWKRKAARVRGYRL